MIVTHRFHPDPAAGDPPDALFYDGCPRCDYLADHPDLLPDEYLAALLNLPAPRTINEERALTRISWAVHLTRRATKVAGLAVGT